MCTVFLLLLCVTGLPLIFRDEIAAAFPDHVRAAALPPSTPDVPLDRLVATAHARYPRDLVRVIFWDDDEPRVIVGLHATGTPVPTQHFLAFDRHTGTLLDQPRFDRGFMALALSLHRELVAGTWGGLFLGVMGVAFVLALASGALVYGPFMRRLDFGTVRTAKGRRTTWFDLHNLLGIVTLAWALIVGVTGVMNELETPLFTYWQQQALPPLLAPYRGLPAPRTFSSADAALAEARRALPTRSVTSIVFPGNPFGSPRHYLLWTHGDTTITSELFTPVLIDAATGALTGTRPLPWYLRAIELSRPLHFGDYGGLPLKVIWALFDLITIIVLLSGVYLWISRRKTSFEARLAEV